MNIINNKAENCKPYNVFFPDGYKILFPDRPAPSMVVHAASISAVFDMFPADVDIIAYPDVTMETVGTPAVYDFAEAIFRSFEHWELRNNFACENPRKRTPEQKGDYVQDIAEITLRGLMDGHDLRTIAIAARKHLQRAQKAMDRNTERVYNPGWSACNVTPRTPRNSYPAMARMLRAAMETAELTTIQYKRAEEYIPLLESGISMRDIAERYGRSVGAVHRMIYAILYRYAERFPVIDNGALASYGITADDMQDVLAQLRKKSGLDK